MVGFEFVGVWCGWNLVFGFIDCKFLLVFDYGVVVWWNVVCVVWWFFIEFEL